MSEYRGRIYWNMESVESMFATAKMILSYKLPHFMMRAALLIELDRFTFYFTSSCFLLFSYKMRNYASFTEVIYIPEEESGFILYSSSSTGLLLIRTILRIFIYLSTVLIWQRGRKFRVFTVSYTASLMMRLLDALHPPSPLGWTLGQLYWLLPSL